MTGRDREDRPDLPEDDLKDMSLGASEDDAPDAAVAEAFTALSLTLRPPAASAALRARLLAAVAAPEHRFLPFVARLAQLIDVAHDRARELLASLARPELWETVLPNVQLFHLEGGPAVAGADVGFVRIAAGASFPHHRHGGYERVLVLQGGFVEDDGAVTRAGASTYRPAGSAHSLTALPDQELIYAVVVFGFEMSAPPGA